MVTTGWPGAVVIVGDDGTLDDDVIGPVGFGMVCGGIGIDDGDDGTGTVGLDGGDCGIIVDGSLSASIGNCPLMSFIVVIVGSSIAIDGSTAV